MSAAPITPAGGYGGHEEWVGMFGRNVNVLSKPKPSPNGGEMKKVYQTRGYFNGLVWMDGGHVSEVRLATPKLKTNAGQTVFKILKTKQRKFKWDWMNSIFLGWIIFPSSCEL